MKLILQIPVEFDREAHFGDSGEQVTKASILRNINALVNCGDGIYLDVEQAKWLEER